MTCTTLREPLAAAMAAVTKVTGTKDYHPVWQCVQLQIVKGQLCIAATDGQVWLNLTLEASGDLAPVCVNAARFYDAVKSLSAELLGLQIEGGTLRIFGGKGKRSLATTPTEDFPTRGFEPDARLPIDAARLKEVVAFIAPHIGDIADHAASSLAALFLDKEDGMLRVIGTDKSNFALIEIGETEIEAEAAIPGRVAELAAVLAFGDVEIGLTEKAVEFRWLGGRILGPQLEDPISRDLLRRAAKHNLTFAGGDGEPFSVSVEGSALLRGLHGVRALGDVDSASRGKRVKLTLNGTATLSTASHEGSAEEEVPMDLSEVRAGGLEIGFSSSRLERVLRSFGDRTLTVAMRDPISPMKFEAAGLPDRVALLFPMRV